MNLKIDRLCFGYIKRPLSVIDFSCEINSGKKIALLGAEGAGKTSLLRVASGLEKQFAGFIYLNRKPIQDVPLAERNFSYIPSEPVFFENKSVKANFEFLFNTLGRDFDEKALCAALERFNLSLDLNKKVKKLRCFEKKILSLVRSYIKNPDLILIDDLFLGEDEKAAASIKNAILTYFNDKSGKIAVIYVENAKNPIFCADEYFYMSYAKSHKFYDIAELKNAAIDAFSYEYFKFYKNDYIIRFDGYNYFIESKIKLIEGKKRKQKIEFKTLESALAPSFIKSALVNEKLEIGDEIEVTISSFANITDLKLNQIIPLITQGEAHIFDKNTLVKIV